MKATEGWLIWSNYHMVYWGPHEGGYFMDVHLAGRYNIADAVRICKKRSQDKPYPTEVIVPSPELLDRLLRSNNQK